MGPWCALWVVLTLLRAVQDKTSTSVAASGTPSLLDFQKDQFQGEWYVVGLAGNAFRKEDRELLNPYTATFELTGNGHIQVSYAMTRGQRCVTWAYTLNPASQPGHFEVDKSRDPQADSEEVQVTDSDYTTFGLMLSRRNSMGRIILRITLLGRSWTLRPEALDKFICLVRAHHLSDEQIVFPAVIASPASSIWSVYPISLEDYIRQLLKDKVAAPAPSQPLPSATISVTRSALRLPHKK